MVDKLLAVRHDDASTHIYTLSNALFDVDQLSTGASGLEALDLSYAKLKQSIPQPGGAPPLESCWNLAASNSTC